MGVPARSLLLINSGFHVLGFGSKVQKTLGFRV